MARPKKQQTQTPQIIKPLVQEIGKPHVLEAIFDGEPEKMPTLKSIGYTKLDNGQWISYVITSKGKDVLLIEAGEPVARQIAEESAKIDFVQNFMLPEF